MGDKLSLSVASLYLPTEELHPRLLCPHLQPGARDPGRECSGISSELGRRWLPSLWSETTRGPQRLPQSLATEEQTCLLKGLDAPLIMTREEWCPSSRAPRAARCHTFPSCCPLLPQAGGGRWLECYRAGLELGQSPGDECLPALERVTVGLCSLGSRAERSGVLSIRL